MDVKKLIALLVALSLLLACAGGLRRAARAEPDNPLSQTAQTLMPETLSGGLSGSVSSGNGQGDTSSQEHSPATDSSPMPQTSLTPTLEPSASAESTSTPEPSGSADPSRTTGPSGTQEAHGTPDPNGGNAAGGDQGDNTDEGNGGTGSGEGSGTDEGEDGSGNAGNPGDGEENKPSIVTDLSNRIVTLEELENGLLPFYAYVASGDKNTSLKVNLSNSGTGQNGVTLTASGTDYKAPMTLGTNYITIYIKQGASTLSYARFAITCQRQKADENNPTVGSHPPSIVTNLADGTTITKNRNFTFTVTARTWDGKVIYSNHILVIMDGVVQRNPTGSTTFEYQLYFERENVGDSGDHKITVLAWDDEGNSAFKHYTVTYQAVDEGDVIGTITVVLDATTVGLGILDAGEVELRQDVPASQLLLDFLEGEEGFGYEASYAGSPQIGFYLRRISRGDMARTASVPGELWALILRDGIQTNAGQHDRDSLGEYDYTMGSGWMYSINGRGYASRGMSSYFPSDGDTLYLRFTLSYGKDIGGYAATGGGYGRLSGYCSLWIDGNGNGGRPPIRLEHSFTETARMEPTDTQDGYIEYTCSVCGEKKQEVLPATGGEASPAPEPSPTPVQTSTPEPSPTPSPTPTETPALPSSPTPDDESAKKEGAS